MNITMHSPDDVCDDFEAAWARGNVPDLREYIVQVPREQQLSLAVELVEIDILRRWSDPQRETRQLAQYLRTLDSLEPSTEDIEKLIESDFLARFEAGDNPGPEDFVGCGVSLASVRSAIDVARSQIDWPVVRVVSRGHILIESTLSRPVIIGRQRAGDPGPHCVREEGDHCRLIIAPSPDASVSRNQLRVEMRCPHEVLLKNNSRNRAIGLRGGAVLAAGAQTTRQLPVIISLSNQSIIVAVDS